MAEVATPRAAGAHANLNLSGQEPATTGKSKREKVAVDGEGKREPLPADEFTKGSFTAAQKLLREQRSCTCDFVACACRLLGIACRMQDSSCARPPSFLCAC